MTCTADQATPHRRHRRGFHALGIMMKSLMSVHPVRPASGYIGGKRNLARRITALIERVPHQAYAEPFVGMGGIFLRRRMRPRAEFINDISGDVATFFRVLQEYYSYLIDMLKFRVASRAEFDRLLAIPPERLTDLQRAVRFLYLQRLAFGGKVAGRQFGVSPLQAARFSVSTIEPMLAAIHERIDDVVIEQLPFDVFIARYDRPEMLFYLDPPYWGCERDYGQDVFGRSDFDRLAAVLAGLRGKFILSINDTPGVRACFSAFDMRAVETTYSVADGNPKRASELLIGNVPLD